MAVTEIRPDPEQSADTPSVKHPSELFNKPSADIVLRSSDNVDFGTYRGILIVSSSFFETMFALPQPPIDLYHNSAIIPMSEDSKTLEILLRLIYPVVDKISENLTLEDVWSVFEAAMKYDMPIAVELMRTRLMDFAQQQPLQVYAKACILNVESLAQHAAAETMKLSTADFNISVEHFAELPAGCYHRLLQARVETSSSDATSYDFSSIAFCKPTPKETIPSAVCQDRTQWQDANSPFNRSDADTIVISQDRVRFRLHSAILKMASPVLEEMLKADKVYPQNDGDLGQDHISQGMTHYLVVLPQSSVVLYELFALLYPLRSDDLQNRSIEYDTLCTITSAAIKYSMSNIVAYLKQQHLTRLKPFQAWLSAVLFDWTDDVKAAATRTLEIDAAELQAMYEPDLERIPSSLYFSLLKYHQDCRDAASAAVLALKTDGHYSNVFTMPPKFNSTCCECNTSLIINTAGLSFDTDFQAYAEEASAVLKQTPHTSILSRAAMHDRCIKAQPSNSWAFISDILKVLETLKSTLTTAVDEATSKVEFSAGSPSKPSIQSDDGQTTTDD